MTLLEKIARAENVWIEERRWESRDVTKMWCTIWPNLRPYLLTRTRTTNGVESESKSRVGQIAWHTSYNKIQRLGKLRRPRHLVHTATIEY